MGEASTGGKGETSKGGGETSTGGKGETRRGEKGEASTRTITGVSKGIRNMAC
jgi:hypothetical protein